MTTPEPTTATVARAAPEIRRILVRSALTISLPAATLLAIGVFWPPVRVFGIVLSLASLVYVVYVVRYLNRALVEFGGGRYRVREATGDLRFSAADAALVVPIDEFSLPGQRGPALVVIGKARRRLVEINAASFGTSTLEALVGDLLARGVPIDHITGRVTPAQFARRHPAVLSLAAAHPIAVQVVVSSIIGAVGVVLTVAWGLLT